MGKAVRGDKETHVRCFSVCPWPYASVLVEQVETWEPVGVPPGLVSFASASCPQREANKVGSTLSPITWLQGEHPAGSAQVDGKQRGCLHLCHPVPSLNRKKGRSQSALGQGHSLSPTDSVLDIWSKAGTSPGEMDGAVLHRHPILPAMEIDR
jgi:hypothetical protein